MLIANKSTTPSTPTTTETGSAVLTDWDEGVSVIIAATVGITLISAVSAVVGIS